MTGKQRAYLIMLLYSVPKNERNKRLNSEMYYFGLSESEFQTELNN